MISIIIKKELVENEKRKLLEGLGFDKDKTNYLEQHIDTEAIFDFFKDEQSFFQVHLLMQNIKKENKSWEDSAERLSDTIKLRILTAFVQSAIKLFSISKTMNLDEIMNLLIDLKTQDKIDTLQTMIADTLESNIQ
ncbi:hypothetical protein [uncultured Chryseobacterium sp.]|uniref:hypothetical protein n=1 Tax=uncultured Chryseobacterium sp. TaxID=259322 RepID=UPI0025FE7041|nr:hypothetical protein [uncultured Chryseobacterium sp.]